ncbi:MAG TPA: zinc ribbon domain-containing protein, partial [Firmicutes bacterium]|nr:zinc ribbon domain-containing protein [Bacillota bacterium]
MKKCEKCGKYIEDSATYCSYCGTKYGAKESDKNKKNKNKVNYYGILALIIAVVPTLFSQILINISSL